MEAKEAVNAEHIVIDFRYKLFGSEEWLKKDITAEEYFDLSMLDEGEELEEDSIPEYYDFLDYFNSERKQIYRISIDILDIKTNKRQRFFQSFWNNQKSWIMERTDYTDENMQYHELIISTDLPTEVTNNPQLDSEIIRIGMEKDDIKCYYHGIIRDNPNGTQSEFVVGSGKGWEHPDDL